MGDNFKKPIFVGKVGKVPKSIKAIEKIIPKPPTLKSENENNEKQAEKHVEDIKEIPKTTSPKENSTEKLVDKVLNYQEPSWSGLPVTNGSQFELEVLKSGVIIENILLMPKKYWVIGRLPNCDIYLAHPTISRYHAILQFSTLETEDHSIGFYIYDLGSTHGTFLNKSRIKSRMYVKVHVGHMLKFGNSTRTFILKGPEEDAEPESELTVTELKISRINELKKREAELLEVKEKEEEAKQKELEQGIDWGMGEDADEETDLTENPYAATNNEELYLDDPKKTLRGFFEREGEELQYNVEEKGLGQFICTVELPIENSLGRPIIAEAIVKGKKKEAVVQCALEACRILDRAGVLRQAKHESRKRKPRNWEEDDYCNSDDDEFFDRTGAVERKKQYRMKIHNANLKENVETYDSLVTKEKTLSEEIENLEKELNNAKRKLNASEGKDANSSNVDSLDEFMNNLSEDIPDKQVVNRLTMQLTKLKQDHAKTLKLIEIAKPIEIPSFETQTTNLTHDNNSGVKKLPLYGKRLKLKSLKETYKSNTEEVTENDDIKEEEEMDETVKEHEVNIEHNKLPKESDKIEENIITKNETDEIVEKETPRIIGPSKPDPEILTKIESIETKPSPSSKSAKKKNKRNKLVDKVYEEDDKYTTWMPPENQKGDGKTDLNEKFGY